MQGEAGEGDTIVNVEDVIGGHANDTLLGNDGDNTLVGAEGNDERPVSGSEEDRYRIWR